VIPLLQIDGSYGEGGGQILRYAVALSVLTKKPVEISNIRAKRPNPGIKPQHLTAISCVKTLCNAKVEGLSINSTILRFNPGEIQPGEYKFDIGTAGSITLVYQACILSLLRTTKPITIKLTGGTDVKWSPPWDYFSHVFLSLLKRVGIEAEARLLKRGYYPKGGGEAVLTINPIQKLRPLKLGEEQDFKEIEGIVHLANLPDHIGRRIRHAALKTFLKENLKASISIEKTRSFSPGTGITLWSKSSHSIIGSTCLGEKGLPAEKIGENAALQILEEMRVRATIDSHAMDQILPYLVLAEGESICRVRELNNHALTNIWLAEKFFETELFEIEDKTDLKVLKVKGLGFF
jgi:RNA 3'-phosphate cyclase